MARPPFGPSDILGVQERMECGWDPGASYEWAVRGAGMTPQERAGLDWRGGAPHLSQEGPLLSQEGALGGAGPGVAQKGWDGVPWWAASQRRK